MQLWPMGGILYEHYVLDLKHEQEYCSLQPYILIKFKTCVTDT